jgi:hypothetical protein
MRVRSVVSDIFFFFSFTIQTNQHHLAPNIANAATIYTRNKNSHNATMQFKNMISRAMLASMVPVGMTAPLPTAPSTKSDAPAKRPIGKTRTIQKEDISFREKRPAGCIRWVSRGPLLGYCGEWEDVVVREEDIPEDLDGEPPMIIKQSGEIMPTQERPVGCVDFVKKGNTVGYCRKWENVEIPKEDQPVEADGSDGNRDHNLRTCTRRPDTCVDWMQVEPTKGYCNLWADEVVEKPTVEEKANVEEKPKVVEKRDVAKAKTREKSPFDIAMPFWTIGAL